MEGGKASLWFLPVFVIKPRFFGAFFKKLSMLAGQALRVFGYCNLTNYLMTNIFI